MLVDIHGVHREQRPGSGPEGMQLLRLAGFHNFGAPCIPSTCSCRVPPRRPACWSRPRGLHASGLRRLPTMETGRLLQGHACAVAVYHALTDGLPVHEVDVRKVQLTGLSCTASRWCISTTPWPARAGT